MLRLCFIIICSFTCYQLYGQQEQHKKAMAFENISGPAKEWVDSVFNTMSPTEKIGQLFMAAAYSNRDAPHRDQILELIGEYGIGGLVFFQGGPWRQAKQTNQYQENSKIPLLIAMDAEWGIGMRLDSTINFPYQMALGAIDKTKQPEDLIYKMGEAIAHNFKRLGMHMNFAPVADVNNNAENPVINYRSFGEQPGLVFDKARSYMRGMQDNGILATAKHFPGHGDTNVDSHYDFPVINHKLDRLEKIELFPFKRLIEEGIAGMMIAHLSIPSLDNTEHLPSTLSKPIVTDLLRLKLGFKGLVVTDAMNMAALTKYHQIGEADVKAIQAGNDLIEFTTDIPKAIQSVVAALRSGEIAQQSIDEKCKKVLLAKYLVGLNNYKPIELHNLHEDLNNPQFDLVNRKLIEASLTVLNNENHIMPIKNLDKVKVASVSVGNSSQTKFQQMLGQYTVVKHFNISLTATADELAALDKNLESFDIVVAGMHQVRRRPSNNDAYPEILKSWINRLANRNNTIIAVFRNPYTLEKFDQIQKADGLIMAYFDSQLTEELTAQLIFGGIGAKGKLPVSIGSKFGFGMGQELADLGRFKYTIPEEVGMDSKYLVNGIDSLVNLAMDARAMPGAQVLVAKSGKVVFHKAYGFQSYFDTIKVELSDLYDLASLTKVSGCLPLIMQLVDSGEINLDESLGKYVPYFKNSNKGDLKLRSILAHQARLKSWIAYWTNTIKKSNAGFKWNTFKLDDTASGRFPYQITDQLYLHKNYKKKIYKAIKKSPLENEAKYLYSGLAFYVFPDMIESLTHQPYQEQLYEKIYNPLGAFRLRYEPTDYFDIADITPTEFDLTFRKIMIHGTVHDEGAAMMQGTSSNAGLFSNANDLAKLFQMYMNMGSYGGQEFISRETLQEFTSYQYPENNNRRGLGFDKPSLVYVPNGNAAQDASPQSFGHTGFTGTRAWADPEYELVYVFMSNRVHPTRENTRLYRLNTRTDIEQVIYDSLITTDRLYQVDK